MDASKPADVFFFQRQNADTVAAPFTAPRIWHTISGLSGSDEHDFASYPSFPAKTDIWVSAIGPTGGAPISGEFDLVLVDN